MTAAAAKQEAVRFILDGQEIERVIARPPNLVNLVVG